MTGKIDLQLFFFLGQKYIGGFCIMAVLQFSKSFYILITEWECSGGGLETST